MRRLLLALAQQRRLGPQRRPAGLAAPRGPAVAHRDRRCTDGRAGAQGRLRAGAPGPDQALDRGKQKQSVAGAAGRLRALKELGAGTTAGQRFFSSSAIRLRVMFQQILLICERAAIPCPSARPFGWPLRVVTEVRALCPSTSYNLPTITDHNCNASFLLPGAPLKFDRLETYVMPGTR